MLRPRPRRLHRLWFLPRLPQEQDRLADYVAENLRKRPELVQQLAVAVARGHKAVREFIESLGIGPLPPFGARPADIR